MLLRFKGFRSLGASRTQRGLALRTTASALYGFRWNIFDLQCIDFQSFEED